MSVLVVGYDLRAPGRNYDDLYAAIKSYPAWCHALGSMWFIDTNSNPASIRDDLGRHIDSNDQLYVIRLHQHWGATSKDNCTEWLNSPNRTWD